ncbi:MAG TPA: CHRD domain-containing protein [Rhizomicrobium sp.]|nr:CHRD domain-containing protein [Rhizomicrobium sp.]
MTVLEPTGLPHSLLQTLPKTEIREGPLATRFWLLLAAFGLFATGTCAAPATGVYETVLGPTPINHASKISLTGDGTVVATLSGDGLKIIGTFKGLSAPATDAHVMMGEGIGIPGNPMLDLTVDKAPSGSINGTFHLTHAQADALRSGRLYIQVNSQKGPAPGGNLWGWLLPEHAKAGQDEPQMGNWFLPQGEGLRASRGRRSS